MPIFEIFTVAAPEVFGAAEGAGAAAEGAGLLGAAETAGLAGAGAEAAGLLGGGAGTAGILGGTTEAAAAASPEFLANPNILADITQERAINSGIMQGANPDLVGALKSNEVAALGKTSTVPYSGYGMTGYERPIPTGPETYANNFAPNQSVGPANNGSLNTYTPGQASPYSNANNVPQTIYEARGATPNEEVSSLWKGFNAVSDWAEKHPFQAAGLGYMAASKLGAFDQKGVESPNAPYSGPLTKYQMSPDFKGRQANPENFRYTPTRYHYASGGITSAPTAPAHPDVGIYRDTDPDTMYLDPLTAAMVRQSKLDSHTQVRTPAKFRQPTPLGTINLKPVTAAQGGIMQAQRYDAGGATDDSSSDVVWDPAQNKFVPRSGKPANAPYQNQFNALTSTPYQEQFTGPASSRALSTEQLADKNNPKAWGNLSDSQKADWFANPKSTYFGIPALGVQEGIQNYWASSPMGKVQNYFAPQEQGRAENITSAARMQQALANAPIQNLSEVTRNPFDTGRGIPAGVDNSVGLGNQSAETRSALRGNEGYGDSDSSSSFAHGGIASVPYNLGGYAAGGNPRLLRGPGDGMSDNIPATINNRQPARLADGEFVVPADVVSHLGNGSTEAGAKKLHDMMTEVRKARTGNPKQGKQINPNKFMPK